MNWIKRIQKLEAGIRLLSGQKAKESQSGAAKISGLNDYLRADLSNLKGKAEAQGDGRLALECVRLLFQIDNAKATQKTGANINPQNGDLDEDTAIRIAKAFLERHPVVSTQGPAAVARGEGLPQDAAKPEIIQAEQGIGQSEDIPPDESADRIQMTKMTNRYEAARQVPSGWLSSKW
jgi:hypothetical protein